MKRDLHHLVFNLLALAVVIYIGVDIFYRVVSPQLIESGSFEAAEVRSQDRSRKTPEPLSSFQVIVDRNLFRSSLKARGPEASPDLVAKEIEALEPTSLKIALLGTVTGSRADARAVIKETGRNTQGLYRVGDTIQKAVIKKILRGRVVLGVGDKDEILAMEIPQPSKGDKKGHAVESSAGGDTVIIARSDIQDSLKNINKLLTQARIRPHMKDGKPDGFLLSYVKAGSFFTRLGLRRGDVIRSINGRQINTPEDAFAFYQSLESGDLLSLEINRGGRPKTLRYRFK